MMNLAAAISIDGTVALTGGNTSTTSPFNVGGDGWLSISGAITGPAAGAPNNELSEIYNDLGEPHI